MEWGGIDLNDLKGESRWIHNEIEVILGPVYKAVVVIARNWSTSDVNIFNEMFGIRHYKYKNMYSTIFVYDF